MSKKLLSLIIFITLGAALITIVFISMPFNAQSNTPKEEKVKIEEPKPEMRYGLLVDSFLVYNSRIKRNQSLAELLKPYKVSPLQIDQIAKQKEVFDVRYMRFGKNYSIFCNSDTSAAYFIYEHTPIAYVKIAFGDTVSMSMEQKEVTKVRRIASGFIESNLWNAMLDYDIDPMMSIELSEIYAWSIDFFGLKKGDHFSVIYEEEYVDTVRVGIGKIHSAVFNHRNKDFYAISFEQDSVESFFDSTGGSLRRAFLKAPLRYSRISSGFSYNRLHPVLKIYRPHTGIDYAAPTGTPVHTVGDGVIISKKYTRQGGRVIKIKHNSVYTTGYLHLSKYATGIKVGAHVKQGQVIGYVGSSGLATGPHLDFRFWRNGKPIDPLKVESPPVEPIKKVNREEYERIRDNMIEQLKEADEKLHLVHPVLAEKIKKKRAKDHEIMDLIARFEYRDKNIDFPDKPISMPGNDEWILQ
jgi:murein DD-endopeptidase MepM/ murein hydrolase activator NlpD